MKDLEQAARAMGTQLQVLNASNSREINAAFSFQRARPDALFVGPGPFSQSARATGPSSDAARIPRHMPNATMWKSVG